MGDFQGKSRAIKSVRKAHSCEQCAQTIPVGTPAKYTFGMYEGYAYSLYTHLECSEAAHAFASLNDLWGEDYPWFQFMDDVDHDHHTWLLENYPVVADRLGIEPEEVEGGATAAVSPAPGQRHEPAHEDKPASGEGEIR